MKIQEHLNDFQYSARLWGGPAFDVGISPPQRTFAVCWQHIGQHIQVRHEKVRSRGRQDWTSSFISRLQHRQSDHETSWFLFRFVHSNDLTFSIILKRTSVSKLLKFLITKIKTYYFSWNLINYKIYSLQDDRQSRKAHHHQAELLQVTLPVLTCHVCCCFCLFIVY